MNCEKHQGEFLVHLRTIHMCGKRSPWIYQVLAHKRLFLSVALEPGCMIKKLCKKLYPDVHELYEPVREFCYSILFGMKRNYELKYGHNSPEPSTVRVHEIRLDLDSNQRAIKELSIKSFEHLSINSLWDRTSARKFRLDHFLDSIKCKNLCEQIYSKAIHGNYIVPCLVLRYILMKTSYLTLKDIQAFATTFTMLYKYNSDKLKPANFMRDKRAVHLATVFVHGVQTLQFVNDVCGFPMNDFNFEINGFFDGLTFQIYYDDYHYRNGAIVSTFNVAIAKIVFALILFYFVFFVVFLFKFKTI
jgi:hypothetical protein